MRFARGRTMMLCNDPLAHAASCLSITMQWVWERPEGVVAVVAHGGIFGILRLPLQHQL